MVHKHDSVKYWLCFSFIVAVKESVDQINQTVLTG